MFLASLGPKTKLLGVFCTYCTYFGCFFKLQSRMARKTMDFFYSILCLHAPSDCTNFQNFWYLLQQSILHFCTMQPRVPVFAAFFRPLSTKGCFCSTDRRVVVIKCLSDKRCRRICWGRTPNNTIWILDFGPCRPTWIGHICELAAALWLHHVVPSIHNLVLRRICKNKKLTTWRIASRLEFWQRSLCSRLMCNDVHVKPSKINCLSAQKRWKPSGSVWKKLFRA